MYLNLSLSPNQKTPNILHFYSILMVFLGLTSCTSIDSVMKSYLGANKQDLLVNWGAPQNTMSDGNGGEIWIYIKSGQSTTPGFSQTNSFGTANTFGNINTNRYGSTYQGNTFYNGTSYTTSSATHTTTWTRTCSFFIDSTGTIYKYAWNINWV